MAGSATLSPGCRKTTAELDFETGHESAERPLGAFDPSLTSLNSESETAPCPSRGLRVLIVDDNPYLSELMAVLLRSDGHDVQVARDGLAALEFVWAHRPEVVLLDIELPVMNGYEVASKLRACEDTKHIFLAALSGYSQSDCDESRDAVFDCYLVKPVDPEELRRLLAFGVSRTS